MKFLRALYSIAIDALFPLHPAEKAVLSCGPEGAWKLLPRAPAVAAARMCGVFAYTDERASRLIWAIKYKKSRECAAIAGHALYIVARQFLHALPLPMKVVIVPMPITSKRRRERGFNQCELIMQEMMQLDAAHASPHLFAFAPGILERIHHTARLTLKGRQDRLDAAETQLFAANVRNIERLISVTGASDASQLFIIVIDDVITTGSTMKSALDALKNAGLSHMCGLSVAH